jgi:hypothetical protein
MERKKGESSIGAVKLRRSMAEPSADDVFALDAIQI